MHSARWDAAHDLTGERVAVIGTGASAIQVVPAIQPIVDSVAVYQRTPGLGGPPHRPPGEAADADGSTGSCPGLQKRVRAALYLFREFLVIGMAKQPALPQAGRRGWRRPTCTARCATRSCARR